MKISVVLPIYNEVENLRPLLEEILSSLAGEDFEIIAVDDGSSDGTQDLLRKLFAEIPQLKVLFFRYNCGQTAAFDAGFRHCRAESDVVVTMDSDLQNDPADIPRMLEILKQGHDLVCGWRKDRKDGLILRKFPSRIANWLIRKVTGTQIHDLGCSLKVFRREITDDLNLYGEMHRFLAPLAESIGARVTETPVNHRARVAGTSKYGLNRTIKVVLDLLTVWFMARFQSKPIYLFGGAGLSLFLCGFLSFSVVLYQKFYWAVKVHRNPIFLIGIVTILIGIQLLSTGLIAEILVRTYFGSQKKTPYKIKDVLSHPAI